MRGHSATWNEDIWMDVYVFRKVGSGQAFRIDKYGNEKFRSEAHVKEGYAICDCRNDRHRRVLEFLIPILYLEKPTRVMVTVVNAIWGAMENQVVHWGRIIAKVVGKLAEHVRRGKTSPISLYLFHLYHHKEVLDNTKLVSYDIGIGFLKYDLTDGIEKDSEEEEKQSLIDSQEKWRKLTNPASQRKLRIRKKEGPANLHLREGFRISLILESCS